ncbi:MAG: M16 family metallopeptidase [Myxococcota bacterium]
MPGDGAIGSPPDGFRGRLVCLVDYQHRAQVLSNGLRFHTVAMPHLHTAFLGFYARVGSRHESPETNGLSHFLEHMYFRGCRILPSSQALNGAIEDLGGSLDGFTARDYTGFQTVLHPSGLRDGLAIMGAMLREPRFDGVEVERRVVREEMLDALDERGRVVELDAVAHRHHFGRHGLGQPIEGTRGNLRRFDREALQLHRNRFYGAQNTVLVAAGPLGHGLRSMAEKAFGVLVRGRRRGDGPRPGRLGPTSRFRFVHHRGPQTRVRWSFRAVPERHIDYPALIWLRRWFDGGLSARLQVELVDRLGLAYEVAAGLDAYSDVGVFDFEMVVANDKLPLAVTELDRVVRDARNRSFTADEVESIKRRARASFAGMLDAPSELGHWLGLGALFSTLEPPERRLSRLLAIGADDLHRAARRTFRPDGLTVSAVGGASPRVVVETKRVLRDVLRS